MNTREAILSGLIFDMCNAYDTYWTDDDIVEMVNLYKSSGFDLQVLDLNLLQERIGVDRFSSLIS